MLKFVKKIKILFHIRMHVCTLLYNIKPNGALKMLGLDCAAVGAIKVVGE